MSTVVGKRGPGRPRAERTANPDLIRQRMRERGIRTIPELGDRVGKLIGKPIDDSTLSRVVSGKFRFIRLQRAVARTLGLALDEAFPKDKPQITQKGKDAKGKPQIAQKGKTTKVNPQITQKGKQRKKNYADS